MPGGAPTAARASAAAACSRQRRAAGMASSSTARTRSWVKVNVPGCSEAVTRRRSSASATASRTERMESPDTASITEGSMSWLITAAASSTLASRPRARRGGPRSRRARRRGCRHPAAGGPGAPDAVLHDEPPFPQQAQQMGEVQRVATRFPAQGAEVLVVAVVERPAGGELQHPGDLVVVEAVEMELLRAGVAQEVASHDGQRSVGAQLRAPVRAEDGEVGRLLRSHQMGQELEGAGVGPVQILQDQDDGALGGDGRQQADERLRTCAAGRLLDRRSSSPAPSPGRRVMARGGRDPRRAVPRAALRSAGRHAVQPSRRRSLNAW